jgi:Thiamine pyrophosphate enzyme, central domain
MEAVPDLLGRCLVAIGVERVVCPPVAGHTVRGPGLRKIVEGNPVLAASIADGDGRVGPAIGAALLEGPRLRISTAVGATPLEIAVSAPADLPKAIARAGELVSTGTGATVVLLLGFAIDASAPDGLPAPPASTSASASADGAFVPATATLPEIPARQHTVVLAGPGVVRGGADAVEGLRAFAAASGFAVANTWGAKGVFEWNSPHHMGTVGLQERDFELLGFADVDLVIATGVDPAEAGDRSRWALSEVVEVDPRHLAELARTWSHPHAAIRPNDFLTLMTGACQPLLHDGRFPMSPARAVTEIRSTMGAGDVVIADPGPAGFWVARTFSTIELGSVVVPSAVSPGIAAAAAIACGMRSPRTGAVAVTTGPVDRETLVAIDCARRIDAPLVLEVWTDASGGAAGATPGAVAVTSIEHHREVLTAARAKRGVTIIDVPVEFADVARLEAVAGPVVAWTTSV